MTIFDPTNLPPQPNASLQSNGSYIQTILTATGRVDMEPGDWVVLNPNAGFIDPVLKNLFQVANVMPDGATIQILYSSDGINYSPINLTATSVLYTFRMQLGT